MGSYGLTIFINTQLTRASGVCSKSRIPKLVRVRDTHIARSFIIIRCTSLADMMAFTGMTCIGLISAQISGSKSGGTDYGQKADTGHRLL